MFKRPLVAEQHHSNGGVAARDTTAFVIGRGCASCRKFGKGAASAGRFGPPQNGI
jgi:hypothetical protein